MKWLDRIVLAFASSFPPIQRLSRRLRETVERQRESNIAFSELARDLSIRKEMAEERLLQIRELRTAEQLCRMSDRECVALAESKYPDANPSTVFKERMWELELALEDRGWVRETTLAALEFSRYGVQQLIRICRVYGIKNPIIKRIAEICELYVFGRGIEIRSDDDTANDVIQDFLKANEQEMGHNGLAEKEKDIQTDGALYFGLATEPKGVRVIMIDPLEIMDVITDEDDSARALYYQRQWNRNILDPGSGRQRPEPQRCWYPALEYLQSKPTMKLRTIGDHPVNWDMPVLRCKIGAPAKWRWGVPPVYAAIDWARAYKDALEDYATVRRTLARFALMVETKGGPGAIAAYQSLLSSTFADSGGTQIERNPPPNVASAHISGPGNAVAAFKSAGAQANPEETRRILLMACASAGMPETFFGDASTGSLATAVSLDRPTELKFTAIQRRWTHTLKMILTYVIQIDQGTVGSRMREAAAKLKAKGQTQKKLEIQVKFPTVIEHAIQPMIQAITEIATMGGRNGIAAGIVDRRTICDLLLAEIGYDNRDTLLDKIYGAKYDPADDVTDQRSQVPPQALMVATGKPLTDLSTPPPLPPPPPPPVPLAPEPPKPGAPVLPKPGVVPPKPGAPPAKPATPAKPGAPTPKEALLEAVGALRDAAGRMNGNG